MAKLLSRSAIDEPLPPVEPVPPPVPVVAVVVADDALEMGVLKLTLGVLVDACEAPDVPEVDPLAAPDEDEPPPPLVPLRVPPEELLGVLLKPVRYEAALAKSSRPREGVDSLGPSDNCVILAKFLADEWCP